MGRNLLLMIVSMLLGGLVMMLALVLVGQGLINSLTPSLPGWANVPQVRLPTPAPTATPTIVTGQQVIRQVQQLSRLETASYSVQTVVTVERPGNVLGVGRQRLLIVVQGTVSAGIDLGRLRSQDVVVAPDGSRVWMRLPEAEILHASLDESQTRIYDFQTGLFTRPDPNLIIEAQKAGAAQILQTACQDGILQRATDQGQRALRQLLTVADFEDVEFEQATIAACTAPVGVTAVPITPTAPTATPRR